MGPPLERIGGRAVSLEGIQVLVRWEDPDAGPDSETGKPGAEAGLWTFHRAPGGKPLTLYVFRRGGGKRTQLLAHPAILTYGALFETHVSAVLRKLQLSNRHELTRWASDRRLI